MTNSITRTKYPLHPKKIIKKTIVQVLLWILYILVIGIVLFSHSNTQQISGLDSFIGEFIASTFRFIIPIIIAAIAASVAYQYWYYLTYYYELGVDHMTIRKGPITPTEVVITYDKIQDIYVDQDILDRILGIYDVHISTATVASGIHAHIDGVLRDAAYGLRDQLLVEVKKRKSNTSV